MIRLVASVWIAAPAATVWAHLTQLEAIPRWSAAVVQAHCAGPVTRGVGAERTCELVGHYTVKERWVAWEEGRSFTYEGTGLPLMKRATNHWAVEAHGAATLLTSVAELELPGGMAGRVLERLLRPQLQRLAGPALAAFQSWVEQESPSPVRAAELTGPRPPPQRPPPAPWPALRVPRPGRGGWSGC